MGTAIEVRGLTKRYGDVLAVDGVGFDVREGEVFGFLGPNGAGKTTTINMLTGLARPGAGTIHFFGRDYTADVKKAQHLMGIVPDESNLWPEFDGLKGADADTAQETQRVSLGLVPPVQAPSLPSGPAEQRQQRNRVNGITAWAKPRHETRGC